MASFSQGTMPTRLTMLYPLLIERLLNFTTNPVALINEFASYLQLKQGSEPEAVIGDSTALLGKFAGFIAEADGLAKNDIPRILKTFSTTLHASIMNDFWIIDSGASDHMTTQHSNLQNFEKLSTLSYVSVANGRGVTVLGKILTSCQKL